MAASSAVVGSERETTSAAPPPAKRSRLAGALRILGIAIAAIVLLLALLLAALWVWSGSEGSLAQALRLAQRFVPLQAQGVSGSIRGGGKIEHLAYRQDGLIVEADDAQLSWQPLALLDKTLKIDRLAARRIRVENKDEAAPKEPSSGPPQSIALPIKVEVAQFEVGRFEWAGPPPLDITDVAGSYAYDGSRHRLDVDRIEVMDGRYSVHATLTDRAPLALDAKISGQLTAKLPGSETQNVGVTLNASARGPLTDLAVHASAETPAAAAEDSGGPARAEVTARITPWAAQPVPEADANFSGFDVGALFGALPHTQLTGQVHVKPVPASAGSSAAGGWRLSADIDNAIAGPYDKQRLPLERLQAEGEWQNGVALIEQLEARVGGGTVRASGQWTGAAQAPGSTPSSAEPGWQIQATLDDVNPAALHTRMAALPIDGKAQVSGAGEAIDFDVDLRTRSASGAALRKASQLTRELSELKLRDASARGRWADGRLSLSSLKVRTDDAELDAALDVQPSGPGGQGKLHLRAPGLDVSASGELLENSGAGVAKVAVDDASRLLRWAKGLPGMPESVKQTEASGRATLVARWQGGWRDPSLDLKLDAPKLDYVPPPAAAASVKTAKAGAPSSSAADSTVHLRDFSASLTGKLSQANLKAAGRAEIGQRKIRLDLAATGGKVGGPGKPLAESAWQATVKKLDAQLVDPALGSSEPWSVSLKNAVPLKWSPTPGTGSFEAGAGRAVLSAPPAAAARGAAPSQASIEWDPVHWSAGELTTRGRLKGLPLAWAELASGGKLAGGRVSGDMVFNGDWDIALGKRPSISANLYRASGDLNIVTDPEAGAASAIAAGVKDARLSVKSTGGGDLNLDLSWNTDRAGNIGGRISTRLSKKEDGGWTLDTDAPLAGNLQVSLPRLSVWSQLAPPGWRIEGEIKTDLKVAGTLARPGLAGAITADDLTLRSIVDGFEFTDGRLRARADGQRLVIDEFTLYGAGGKAKGGSINARGSAGLEGSQPRVKLSATLDHLRPSLRTDVELAVSGEVQASLEDRQVAVTGALKVDQARIQLPEDSAPSLGKDVVVHRGGAVASGAEAAAATARPPAARTAKKSQPEAQKKSAASEPQLVKLDVRIDLGRDFQVSGLGVQSGLQGELSVSGESLTDPHVAGTIRTVDGKYRAYGQRLNIDHGLIRFTGRPTEPALDILAKRANMEFADVQVGVEITGTALLPRVRLWSDPDLPDNEKLSWLVLGRASASSGAEAALLQTAALALISGKDSGGGIADVFGLDELSLGEARGAGGGSTTGDTAVTLGKRFSKNFYAAYERSLSGTAGTLFLFFDLSKRFTLRGATGERSAVDLIYTLKYD